MLTTTLRWPGGRAWTAAVRVLSAVTAVTAADTTASAVARPSAAATAVRRTPARRARAASSAPSTPIRTGSLPSGSRTRDLTGKVAVTGYRCPCPIGPNGTRGAQRRLPVSWRLVDGVPVPDAVGGHLALDFCNTRAGWGDPAPKEYLTGPRALVVWARSTGLCRPITSIRPRRRSAGGRDDALARALALREALYACALHRGGPADWALVSAEAARARAAAVLVPAPDGQAARPGVPTPRSGPPPTALTAVAAAAEDLLTSSLSAFVAACPGEGCGWLFADRRGKRRWCSMAAVRQPAKAAAYAERRCRTTPNRYTAFGGHTNRPNS